MAKKPSFLQKSSSSAALKLHQQLPSAFHADGHIVDEIDEQCTSKVLVILAKHHVLSDYTILSEYIENDPEFNHLALPSITIVDSEALHCDDYSSQIDAYIKLAQLIKQHYFDFDGFVVIEKLGKLSYCASYLSFLLENLSKCVCLTSSTTKLDHAFNDAKSNLISSLIVAGRSSIPEVCVCFDRRVYRGNRVIRHDQSSRDAFSCPNIPPLAEFGTALIIQRSLILPIPKRGFRIFTKLHRDILVLVYTPCTSLAALRLLLCGQKGKGIVLSIFGAGNLPESSELRSLLRHCVDNGCQIVVTTQCTKGHVNMEVYATGNSFRGVGLITAQDMTIEACVAKLAYLMGKGLKGAELRNRFQISLVGELTPMHMIKGRIVDYKNTKGDYHGMETSAPASTDTAAANTINCVVKKQSMQQGLNSTTTQ